MSTTEAELETLSATPLSRRNFIVTALGAGFALAVQPVAAQTAITTSTEGLLAGEIKVPTRDGEMPAYRAQPAKGNNFPVILVVQEIFGVHEHIKDICRRLAHLGYLAIAPELYARQGDPRQFSDIQVLLANIVSKVPDAQVMADLDASARSVGRGPRRRPVTHGDHRFLLGRPHYLAVHGTQPEDQGRRRLVRPPGRSRHAVDTEASSRYRRKTQRPGTWSLRRPGPEHPGRHHRPDAP